MVISSSQAAVGMNNQALWFSWILRNMHFKYSLGKETVKVTANC